MKKLKLLMQNLLLVLATNLAVQIAVGIIVVSALLFAAAAYGGSDWRVV